MNYEYRTALDALIAFTQDVRETHGILKWESEHDSREGIREGFRRAADVVAYDMIAMQETAALLAGELYEAEMKAEREARPVEYKSRAQRLAEVLGSYTTSPCPECDGEQQEIERLNSDDYSTPCHMCNGTGVVLEVA